MPISHIPPRVGEGAERTRIRPGRGPVLIRVGDRRSMRRGSDAASGVAQPREDAAAAVAAPVVGGNLREATVR